MPKPDPDKEARIEKGIELIHSGMSTRQAAMACNVPRSTLQDIYYKLGNSGHREALRASRDRILKNAQAAAELASEKVAQDLEERAEDIEPKDKAVMLSLITRSIESLNRMQGEGHDGQGNPLQTLIDRVGSGDVSATLEIKPVDRAEQAIDVTPEAGDDDG